jgi:small subunit ribosomal protein S20
MIARAGSDSAGSDAWPLADSLIGGVLPGRPAKCLGAVPEPAPSAEREPRENYVANIKSQIKRNATNEKRRLRNKAVKSELRTAVRSAREAAASGDAEATRAALVVAGRKLDKAASKGVIHKNQAANRKSALAKRAVTP